MKPELEQAISFLCGAIVSASTRDQLAVVSATRRGSNLHRLQGMQTSTAFSPAHAAAHMMIDNSFKKAESDASPSGEEGSQRAKRRAVLRCALVASAEVTELASKAQLKARTSELGLGGCYIDTLNPFPEGTPVQLRILRDNGVFESHAKVVYSDVRFGMGLAFTEMTGEQRSLLENWLAELVTKLKSAS